MRLKFLIPVIGLFMISIIGCEETTEDTEETETEGEKITETTIEELKQGNFDPGDSIRLEGTFVGGRSPFLVDDAEKLLRNAPLKEQSYARMDCTSVVEFAEGAEKGQILEVTGVVQEFDSEEDLTNADLIGEEYLIGLELTEPPKIVGRTDIDLSGFRIIDDLCDLNPALCDPITTIQENKYALLYSGGYNSANNYPRYWNDLKFMYLTLVNKHGYDPNNIKVVYASGTPEDNQMPVDYAASSSGLNNAFSDLQTAVDGNDKLFVFTTNHGGGYHSGKSANYSGLQDTNGDENDVQSIDETMARYNASSLVSDDAFASQINNLNAGTMIMVFEPCFSGGFLADVSGTDRVVMSAATATEFSWALQGGGYDAFAYHFTSAVNGSEPNGNPVYADSNGDGDVSMLEAFQYATNNDSQSETPLYEDSGDGIATSSPTATGTDGQFGSNVTL